MNKRLVSITLFVNLVWLACGAFAKPFSDLVIFGGSLADTGNFASVTGDLPPPYYMNRISNGPVATDVIAAWSGFEGRLRCISRSGPIDLNAQMDAYFESQNNVADPDALYSRCPVSDEVSRAVTPCEFTAQHSHSTEAYGVRT